MKNSQAISIYQNKEMLNSLKGYVFCKTMHSNFKKIKEELDFVNEYVKPSKEFLEFLNKKELILKECSDNTFKQDGDMINYTIKDDKKETYNKEITALLEEYKDAVEAFKEQKNKYQEAMDAECTIDFTLLKESHVPDDISMEQMELIMEFVKM